MLPRFVTCVLACCLGLTATAADESVPAESADGTRTARAAIQRVIPLLEAASAGSADERTCFTCHSQAMPVLALSAARLRGFAVDEKNLERQVQHTAEFLQRGKDNYDNGKGQGGGIDTAGYALWTLSAGEIAADETTGSVTAWILQKQHSAGYWNCSSNRPPTEKSHFTTTYVALRALAQFGTEEQQQSIREKHAAALKWLTEAEANETEDVVFRLLSLSQLNADQEVIQEFARQLLDRQEDDGGWSQLDDLPSDAYATATSLYALHHAADIPADSESYQRGVRFLLEKQLEDGSWYIKSRSKPFQEYFETGFPHDVDQFISTSASCWAVLAILPAVPDAAETVSGE